jgi:hypothetical protein
LAKTGENKRFKVVAESVKADVAAVTAPSPEARRVEEPAAAAKTAPDATIEAALALLKTVRAPGESRLFFIPLKDDNKAPYHTARSDMLYAIEKEGFSNIKIIFYDGTEKGLMDAVAEEALSPTYDMDGPRALALAYVDANTISKDAVIEHNKTYARFKWISEDMPTGDVPAEELFMHVAFGLPVLDYVKNSADPEHRAKLLDIIEKMVDNGRKDIDLLKADFNNLFVSGIILMLKKITKIDINAEMHRRQRTLKEILTAA